MNLFETADLVGDVLPATAVNSVDRKDLPADLLLAGCFEPMNAVSSNRTLSRLYQIVVNLKMALPTLF
jgi:hypothetical protein